MSDDPSQPAPLAKPADVALADDPSSFDPEHPFNRQLRDNGIGLVPRVHRVNHAEKYAVLAAGAVVSSFRVPFGWHCIDDGRRTLIFDPQGSVQINLALRTHAGPITLILDEIAAELRRQQPDLILTGIEPLGFKILIACNLRVGNEELSQTYWPLQVDPGTWVMCRTTAALGDAGAKAMDTTGVIMMSLRYATAMEAPEPEAQA